MDAGNVSSMSSIGLGKTMTEAFADLRVEQGTISMRAKELIKMYEELKGKEDEAEVFIGKNYCQRSGLNMVSRMLEELKEGS